MDAGARPYGYRVWANLACTVPIVGPATAAGLRHAGTALVRRRDDNLTPTGTSGPPTEARLAVLVPSAALAPLVADLSGMSKAETERSRPPFAVWPLPARALQPRPHARPRRPATQAVLAPPLNHLPPIGW